MGRYLDIGDICEEIKDKINVLKKEKKKIQKYIDDLGEDVNLNTKKEQKLTYKLSRLTIKESEINKKRLGLESRMEKLDEKMHKLEKILLDAKKGGI